MRIVDFESQNSATNKPLLDVENLEAILSQGARDIPTNVISVGGVARSGKSFLLNLIVSYLTYIEKVREFPNPRFVVYSDKIGIIPFRDLYSTSFSHVFGVIATLP